MRVSIAYFSWYNREVPLYRRAFVQRVLIVALLVIGLIGAVAMLAIASQQNGTLAVLVVSPTSTHAATATATAPPTNTPTPTATPTTAATATATATATPSVTPTPSATPLRLSVKLDLSSNKVQQGHVFLIKLTS